MAAQVDGDHRPDGRQPADHRIPGRAALGDAVHEHERLTRPRLPVADHLVRERRPIGRSGGRHPPHATTRPFLFASLPDVCGRSRGKWGLGESNRRSLPSAACTRSCTATRTSRSSTAPAIRRSWSRRRRGSGSAALGAHRPRRFLRGGPLRRGGARARLPTVFGAELTLGAMEPRNGMPIPGRATDRGARAQGTGGYAAARPGDQRGAARAARRGPRCARQTCRAARTRATARYRERHCSCSPVVARARCRLRSTRDGPSAAGERSTN